MCSRGSHHTHFGLVPRQGAKRSATVTSQPLKIRVADRRDNTTVVKLPLFLVETRVLGARVDWAQLWCRESRFKPNIRPPQGGMRLIFRDETEKLDLWKFTTRPRPKKSGCWIFEWDETKTRLSDFFMSETRLNSKIPGETEMRPRVSVSFFTRLRREPTFF